MFSYVDQNQFDKFTTKFKNDKATFLRGGGRGSSQHLEIEKTMSRTGIRLYFLSYQFSTYLIK